MTTNTTIDNYQDVIDSRDVIERIEELQSEFDDTEEGSTERQDWCDEYGGELESLKSLAAEAEGYASDWQYGETLIRDSYFTDYARELLEDCGDLPKDLPHYIEIDWEATARNIQMDYTSVDFDGVTYWIR